MAATALGRLALRAASGAAQLLVTPTLTSFTDTFDWNANSAPLLYDIYRFHRQLFLQPSTATIIFDIAESTDAVEHPLPCAMLEPAGPLTDIWQHEVGTIRARHDRVAARPGFVGIACAEAWAGVAATSCEARDVEPPALTTVGPNDLAYMEDAFTMREIKRPPPGTLITPSQARANIGLLGGTIRRQEGTSHLHQVTFRNGRTWPIDSSLHVIPDDFLAELGPITGFKLRLIKSVLYFGVAPERVLRLA